MNKTGGLIIVLLFCSNFAYGYSDSKCTRWLSKAGGGGVGGLIFSSTSFTSSFGPCSAIGMIEKQQQFLAVNDELLMIDTAKGQGEYLSAYASLSGCNELGKTLMGKTLQQNFQDIWGDSFDGDIDKVHTRINNILSNDPVLGKECKVNHAG